MLTMFIKSQVVLLMRMCSDTVFKVGESSECC